MNQYEKDMWLLNFACKDKVLKKKIEKTFSMHFYMIMLILATFISVTIAITVRIQRLERIIEIKTYKDGTR